jgi:hypothetical protein
MVHFLTKNPNLGKILEGLAIFEDVGIFYSHSVYFSAIRNNLWPFGSFYGYLVYFFYFGMLYQKNLATLVSFGGRQRRYD